jgi:hypothetical protein
MKDANDLIGETDAEVWATYWLEAILEHPNLPADKSTMTSWFANAIMAGYDQGRQVEQRRNIIEKLREIVYQAVGVATVPFMEDHPTYVLPDARIREGVEKVLEEFGIPKVEGY